MKTLIVHFLKYIFSPQIIILHVTFLICWTPYAMQSFAGVLGLDENVPVELTVLPLYFAKVIVTFLSTVLGSLFSTTFSSFQSSVLWNPIIYVLTNSAVSVFCQVNLKDFKSIFSSIFSFNWHSYQAYLKGYSHFSDNQFGRM